MSGITVETDEVWKIHPVCDGRFMVSNKGRVMNHKRGKLMKLQCYNNGHGVPYPHFATMDGGRGGKAVMCRVHRLVAECFIPNIEGKPHVNHIDGDKENNRVENLEWCTHQENVKHAFDTGLAKNKKGLESKNARLSKENVDYIRSKYKPFCREFGARAIAKKLNVSHNTILHVVHHERY